MPLRATAKCFKPPKVFGPGNGTTRAWQQDAPPFHDDFLLAFRAFVPFLRRSALIKEWAQLLEHARRLDACRKTGWAWGYTC